MIDFTPLSKPFFSKVFESENRLRQDVERSQRATLRKLLHKGCSTVWGRDHGISPSDSYAGFAAKVAPAGYEAFRPLVGRMLAGEKDILWPGVCRRFAQSSGTSGGKSKYIPLTADSLNGCHYAGAAFSFASYLHHNPGSRVFGGKNFILGGSFANELGNLPSGVKVGDLSASLIDRINPLVNLFRIPDKPTALLADWEEKLPRLVESSVKADVRSISGVPSWFLTVLRRVLEYTGAESIHQVWPNLEVFFHGGIAFGPYRAQYDAILDPAKISYWENYNASEGFFACQLRPGSEAMGLLLGNEIFYEFIPLEEGEEGTPVPAWEVIPGKVYEMVITSSNGLWRYRLGDTVKIQSTSPLAITIAGRTKAFINAFGEELMVYNADAAIGRAAAITGADVADYTAAPVYAESGKRGRHQWVIDFSRMPDCGADGFALVLDAELQKENSDYQAKRSGGIFLDPPQVIAAAPGLFNRWLAETGKLGGQRKIPRLSNSREVIDRLIELNNLK